MSYMYSNTPDNDDDSILDQIQAEYDAIQLRLREARTTLEQNNAEVKRLEDEYGRAKTQLARIHASFDTVPRPDIKVAYDTIINTQSRLWSMQNQLEKLRNNQQELQHFSEILEVVLAHLESQGPMMLSSNVGVVTTARPKMTATGETIIRIVQAQEDERQLMAKNLHDGPAQSLTNFILQAEVCQRLFDRDPDRASVELNNLKTAASASFQKVRDFIFDLRPMMLDDLGLVPTLRRYTENFRQKYEVSVDFNSTGEERRIPKHTEVMMFRSIQSLLGITRDYLGAKNIKIQLDMGNEVIAARMEDDGKGFDPEVALDHRHGDSNVQGLNAVRERVELVGGEVDIYSAPGEGSRFQIVLPIYEEDLEPDL
ncbi:MAG: hypothetical protein H6673_13390 [Anaerolineales bacterium]|nr:hypothetical protein [Anaerolineales bacterium]